MVPSSGQIVDGNQQGLLRPPANCVSLVPLHSNRSREEGLLTLEERWCSVQGGLEKAGGLLSGFSLFVLPEADKRERPTGRLYGSGH